MKMRVFFQLDGLIGCEVFDVLPSDLLISAYTEAVESFWRYVAEIGAVRIEPARSAWDHVQIFHGPKVLAVAPVGASHA